LRVDAISQVIIASDYSTIIDLIKQKAPKNSMFEMFIRDDVNFKVEDANEVIAKAYLASDYKVFIILYANSFSEVVQNRLLKIIEEPPKNKEFILITPSKAALLSTIKSRLPIVVLESNTTSKELDLNFDNLSINEVYAFLQKNRYLKPKEAIAYLESIVTKAIKSQKFNLDEDSFKLFENARVALNLGSPADFVLSLVLLKLLAKKAKKI